MSRPMFACQGCGAEYVTPLAAAECCDPMWDKPSYERAYD